MGEQSSIEPWQLPTMTPSANPIFVSPPCKSKIFNDPSKSPSKYGPSYGLGAVISPLRGRSGRRNQAIPSTGPAFELREDSLPVLMPTNTFNFPNQRKPAIMSSATPSTSQLLFERQLATWLPTNAQPPGSPPPQQTDVKDVATFFELAVPLRNRRMTSPAEMHHPRPRRMTMSSLPTLKSPFNSPPKPIPATPVIIAPAYQIRNPVDLMELVQAYPTETFTRIQDLGRENLRLKDEVKFLRNESKFIQGSANTTRKNYNDTMMKHFHGCLSHEWNKQNLLHCGIERLENQIIQLKGGGRMVKGEWMSNAQYATIEKETLAAQGGVGVKLSLGILRENNWEGLVAEELSVEAEAEMKSPTLSSGSDEREGVEGKGKEKPAPRLRPNAQPFVPSVTSSPGKSENTEIFSPFRASPAKTETTSPTASNPIPYGPPTYASFLNPQQPTNSGNSRYRPSNSPPKQSPPSPSPASPHIPDVVLDVIQQTFPPIFRSICPFSLSGFQICPLGGCPMKKLCREFNEQNPNQNHARISTQSSSIDPEKQEFCSNRKCKHIHEYATCTDDLAAVLENSAEARRKKFCWKRGKQFKWHTKKRVHKDQITAEEWRIRETIANMRVAHAEGRYL